MLLYEKQRWHFRWWAAVLPAVLGVTPAAFGEAPAHPPALWGELLPGPHAVGYRRLDHGGEVVHAWYPTAVRGVHLTFGNYLGAGAPELRASLVQAGVDSTTVDSLIAAPLAAVASAPPLEGSFPLVLVAQGNGEDVADQAVLCEYLASRGFVVATTPSPMLREPLEREDQIGARAETQASELAAAMETVTGALPADGKRIGVVGHSFGARAALLLAMRDSRVAALVSLDGGIGTATGTASLRSAPSFRAEAALPPILHFYEELDAFMTPDFALLRSLRPAKLVLQPTDAMHHIHFTTFGFAAGAFPALGALTQATPETAAGAVAMARATAAFLDWNLNKVR